MESVSHPSQLPSVDRILQSDLFADLKRSYGRETVLDEVRQQLQRARKDLLKQNRTPSPGGSETAIQRSVIEHLHTRVSESLQQNFAGSLQRVFNLTGTVLHTNLGRAPYPEPAIEAMIEVSRGACNLEYNLDTGRRGQRDDHVEKWICKLTGAEAATTVNNNAAAVMLTLNSIARKKNVIVSRGELIEIGGSFRVPAIMKKAGCRLREVGTTNRTHLHDYERAIGKNTAALMKVHTSNYEINGFTKSIAASELADLAQRSGVVLIDDLGSGTLTDLTALGLPYERTASDALRDGADVITFSGDKLLGGPQCGIIAGRSDLIRKIENNPMKRAMRLDKVTLAALEAVLKLYAQPLQLAESVPALKMLSRRADSIEQTALSLKDAISQLLKRHTVSVQACESQIGSGALPTKTIASNAVVITGSSTCSAAELANRFRSLSVPIIGRVAQDALWLDCRTIETELTEITAMLESELI